MTLMALATTAAITGAGGAQALGTSVFPTKPITLIVPAAPGSTTDIAARMLGVSIAAVSGREEEEVVVVVVDNRGGANGVSAAVVVKRAEPDGHTLMMQYSGYHVTPQRKQAGPATGGEGFAAGGQCSVRAAGDRRARRTSQKAKK